MCSCRDGLEGSDGEDRLGLGWGAQSRWGGERRGAEARQGKGACLGREEPLSLREEWSEHGECRPGPSGPSIFQAFTIRTRCSRRFSILPQPSQTRACPCPTTPSLLIICSTPTTQELVPDSPPWQKSPLFKASLSASPLAIPLLENAPTSETMLGSMFPTMTLRLNPQRSHLQRAATNLTLHPARNLACLPPLVLLPPPTNRYSNNENSSPYMLVGLVRVVLSLIPITNPSAG